MALIFHAHLFGLRDEKYRSLLENDISTTQWAEVSPQSPFYLFVPQNTDLRAEYEQGWKVTDVMKVNVLGFQTHRDSFAIDFDREQLRHRIGEMRNTSITDRDYRDKYGVADNRDWQLAKARRMIQTDDEWESRIIDCLYRPFDWRPSYFSEIAMDYPRRELLDHVAWRENLCLGLGRQGLAVNEPQWSLIATSRLPIDANIFRRGGINVFPLYLYPTEKQAALHPDTPTDAPGGRRPNLNPEFVAEMEGRLGMSFVLDGKGDRQATFGPEDVFNYMYAIFHSPTYRSRYAEFLKIDFPRLPLTSDAALFRKLCDLGGQLVGLHLMERSGPAAAMPSYPVAGDNKVEKVQYNGPGQSAEKGRVYINREQYFEGVPPEVWDFHIGGYRVAEKWLKDRKGRTLTYEDLAHYRRVIAALSETIRLMAEIDAAIPSWPVE